ncbi:site-specific integrase [Ruegeria sp. HKCCA5763]|uniref:tyrosine-type recombinase/integrase n=1 Tax=Ruegeria sp. HKCCA5763 TaxID=2682987 RepID=UPI001488F311|nr:site-specific integrase [Ruegeria sp. HKCCA5763]
MIAEVVELPKRSKPRSSTRRERLTEPKLRAMKPPTKGERIVWDFDVPGLGVRLTSKGSKAYVVKRWNPEKRQSVKVSLGPVGSISIAVARAKARELLESKHDDLNTARKINDADNLTVRAAFDAMLADKQGIRSVDAYQYFWNNYVEPTGLGSLRLKSVGVVEIETLVMEPLLQAGKTTTSDRVRAILSMTWRRAMKRGQVVGNPVSAIPLKATETRKRTLNPSELRAFVDALDEGVVNSVWCDLFRLLLATGQRKGATMAMRWTDLDLDAGRWTIPSAQSKNKRDTTITLSKSALDVLARRRIQDPGATWVFPSNRNPAKHISAPEKAWRKLCATACIDGATPHDIRRTVGTKAGRAGLSAHQIAALLGHQSIQSAKAYVHLEGASQESAEVADLLGDMQ